LVYRAGFTAQQPEFFHFEKGRVERSGTDVIAMPGQLLHQADSKDLFPGGVIKDMDFDKRKFNAPNHIFSFVNRDAGHSPRVFPLRPGEFRKGFLPVQR
jgi:hypothetical protein